MRPLSAASPSASPPPFEPRGPAWVEASASPATDVHAPNPRCLSDVGCPFPAIIIPLCDADARAAPRVDVAPLLKAGASRRGDVLVEGTLLAHAVVTSLGCPVGACCNRSGGRMHLAQMEAQGVGTIRIPLRSEAHPNAFSCGGDDSTICCGFGSGHVLAFGTFDGSALLEPRLCRLEP